MELKLKILSVLTCCLSSLVFGQSDTVFIKMDRDRNDDTLLYQVDTLIFANPMDKVLLHGNMMLPNTSNQRAAMNYGLILSNVETTPCESDFDPSTGKRSSVNSIYKKSDVWICSIRFIGNCCHQFLSDFTVVEDSIVNLMAYGYGNTYCECNCCFGLTYTIAIDLPELAEPIKYVMINGDRNTLYYINPKKH